MCLALLAHKVLLGNMYLVLKDIARDVNHLHTITQSRRNVRDIVCRSDEQHLRKVVLRVEVVIVECSVLLRVENLQKGARWVAMVRLRHLVDLVEDNHRVRSATTLDGLYNTTRHSTDICASMTTNLRLVVQATECNATKLSAQSLSYRLAQRCFTNSWRAIQAEDR